ncbi:hypothetical protein QH494_25565 [Sphingomonas sp. AR_OL41]|uniref:hypothetical protein n=1 Tax=Sphingomonas sp. AR_OL41 TaxID=3042729 RepID=UPI0024806B5A|nr:hypothetical protein [Sphingomonas sp. AR_OL41]MDH7975567.1 hypothetical protein [Sphingomonas sp. AR_OL41]
MRDQVKAQAAADHLAALLARFEARDLQRARLAGEIGPDRRLGPKGALLAPMMVNMINIRNKRCGTFYANR